MANSIPHVANVTRETIDVSVHGNKAKSNGVILPPTMEAGVFHDCVHHPLPSPGYLQTHPHEPVAKPEDSRLKRVEDRRLPRGNSEE